MNVFVFKVLCCLLGLQNTFRCQRIVYEPMRELFGEISGIFRVAYQVDSVGQNVTPLYATIVFYSEHNVKLMAGLSNSSFFCILVCFAGQFRYIFAVFAGNSCKNSKNIPYVSAVGAKGTEKWKALNLWLE